MGNKKLYLKRYINMKNSTQFTMGRLINQDLKEVLKIILLIEWESGVTLSNMLIAIPNQFLLLLILKLGTIS